MNQEDSALLYETQVINDPVFEDVSEYQKERFRKHMFEKQQNIENQRTLDKLEQDEEKYFSQTDPIQGQQKVRSVARPIFEYDDLSHVPLDQGGSFGVADNERRKTRFRKNVYTVDSRDRDLSKYPNANEFRIQLDRIYNNVKSVNLVSTEFPNTEKVIKGEESVLRNNRVIWTNAEDQDLVPPFPEYEINITPGNYNASTLVRQMEQKMSAVRRTSNGKPHNFDLDIDLSTGIVNARSIDPRGLTNNPISVEKDSNVVTVYYEDTAATPSWNVGDTIYIEGFKGTVGGIAGGEINGYHTVTNTTLAGGPITITASNRVIDFVDTTTNFASLTTGVYASPAALAAEIQTRMNQASTAVYNVSFVGTMFTFTSATPFSLLFGTGTNIGTSAGNSLGFAAADTPTATSAAGNAITDNAIQFEVSNCAVFDDFGGGKAVRAGTLLPFMFKFGSNTDTTNNIFKSDTIGATLGYPESDSSSLTPLTLRTITHDIQNVSIGTEMTITTLDPHELLVGDKVFVSGIVTTPSIVDMTNANFPVSAVVSPTSFRIPFSISTVNNDFSIGRVVTNKIVVTHNAHGLVNDDLVAVHFVPDIGQLKAAVINETYRPIAVIDANNYSFSTEDIFPKETQIVSGNYRVSSFINATTGLKSGTLYGFGGNQSNTKDGTNVFASLNLEGENYVLLTSPQLGTFATSTEVNERRVDVRNVFAKLLLIGAPGTLIFNSYIASPKTFDNATAVNLEFFDFRVTRQDGVLYDFSGLNFSFSLEITEYLDFVAATGFNTRRGIRERIDEV